MTVYGFNLDVIFFLVGVPAVVPINTYPNGTQYNDPLYTGTYTYNTTVNPITGGAPIPPNCNNA